MTDIACVQGSPEWHAARLGIPTASRFGCLMTATGKPSLADGAKTYARELAYERITGQPASDFQSPDMERGHVHEPHARAAYEALTGHVVTDAGFTRRDDIAAGASPDGLVDYEGGFEAKSKNSARHIKCLLSGAVPTEHIAQIQGQMWVCDLPWVDFVSFCPGLPLVVIRVPRDEEYIQTLAKSVAVFNAHVDEVEWRVRDYGPCEPLVFGVAS